LRKVINLRLAESHRPSLYDFLKKLGSIPDKS
jgi:hypothetical protein